MKHCVITGAADGIGRALALRYAQAGYTITGIDIDAERAEQTQAELQEAGQTASFIMANLAEQGDLGRIVGKLESGPKIDTFIHNAGISAVGPFARVPLTEQRTVLEINLVAPMLLTSGLLKQQLLNPGCNLIFISSLSRFVSYPGAAVYAASKDGLAAYARSVAAAVGRDDMHTLTVYPGPTRTAHARRYSPNNNHEKRRMPPEVLAEKIYQAAVSGRPVLIPTVQHRLFALAGRLMPRLAEWAMRKSIFDKLQGDG
ncbi:MAG: SDR family NAD(P)-dependent oxidoreductase [Anaerolineae bacterium]|nr:SDR family NAD(P)-dependent oxidoreductase [Anaerolineae bacterium]